MNSTPPQAALAVAASLVGTYAELRQLEVLLDSLAQALLGTAGRESRGKGGPHAGATEAAAAAGAAAGQVLCSAAFEGSLRAAMRGLPSGQAAGVVRWVVAKVAMLSDWDPVDPLVPVFTEVRKARLQNALGPS